MTDEKLWAENQWLRAELRKANRQIEDLRDNNPLAPRLHRVTLTLIEAICLLRRPDARAIDKFLQKIRSEV